ncbi:MAG: hypothetical protein IPL36_07535 [Nigerium sp.]|nr:hypothetical protein [Nigerium sp.]
MARHTPESADGAWSRGRLFLLLVVVFATVVALFFGLGVALWASILGSGPAERVAPHAPNAGVRGEGYRDQLAAQPMLQVPSGAATTPSVGVERGPTMTLPEATSEGPARVQSGFPRTAEGAVAQLAAITVTVVEAMSIPVAHEVHTAWSRPGGVPAGEWAMTHNVQSFLTAAGGQDHTKDDTILVVATPVAGQVKGTDGPDWVLACVLLDVRAAIVTDARIGYGHCERMVWTGGRWLIGPGTPPATAPSTWPGSDLAIQAGWRTFEEPR